MMDEDAPQVIRDLYELMIWLIPLLDQFPRSKRFTIGDRLETQLLTILELLIEAAYSHKKQNLLAKANRQLHVCRYLWRLSHDLKIIPTKRYEHGAKRINDLGKQIGGWSKSLAGNNYR